MARDNDRERPRPSPRAGDNADLGHGVRRRDFLRLSVLAPLAAFATRLEAVVPATPAHPVPLPDRKRHRFTFDARRFLLDGQPFTILSGEMHPIRIPRAYWRQRIRMARAMGLNTIALYVMWNALEAEPGHFDLVTGRRDFARFIRICEEEGMWVYLRPGPYVCGEWDFGGLPPYLLRHPDIRVRDKDDPDYMAAVRRYIATLAPVIQPLMVGQGGPVLMLQIENEYASFGNDLSYLGLLRHLWEQNGIEGPFAISDGLTQIRKAHTWLPGAALGLDGDTDFAGGQAIAGEMPVWMGEGYPGWLTHWGDATFARGDFTATLRELLEQGRSFNLYVVHGGTNFGFGAGANAKGDYSEFQPVITSYDYGAPIDERGAATPDYHAFRKLIAASTGRTPPAIPEAPAMTGFPAITPEPFASLWDNLPQPVHARAPKGNELLLGQGQGMVVYRRRIDRGGELKIDGVRDYALAYLDGRYLDSISRVRHASLHTRDHLALPVPGDGREAILDLLIDSFGHINYGQAMADRKGIVGAISLDGTALEDWDVFGLPLDDAWLAGLKPLHGKPGRGGVVYKARLHLDVPGDVYLDMADWSKGYLWVNGHLLGRYWQLGPQQRLYCPGPWLRAGDNEITVLDLHRTRGAPIRAASSLGNEAVEAPA